MVYNSLSELIESEIHALKIKALTPAEFANFRKGKI
jgi:acid stress-induced BolA-like protein IbaG/YrbA